MFRFVGSSLSGSPRSGARTALRIREKPSPKTGTARFFRRMQLPCARKRTQLSTSGSLKERVACFSPLSSGNMVPAGMTGRIRGLMKAFAVRAETALLR